MEWQEGLPSIINNQSHFFFLYSLICRLIRYSPAFQMMRSHEYCIQRHAALSTLRAFTGRYSRHLSELSPTLSPGESFVAEDMTAEKMAEIIITALNYTLIGHDDVIKELGDPAVAWQGRLTFGDGQNEVQLLLRTVKATGLSDIGHRSPGILLFDMSHGGTVMAVRMRSISFKPCSSKNPGPRSGLSSMLSELHQR